MTPDPTQQKKVFTVLQGTRIYLMDEIASNQEDASALNQEDASN